MKNNVLVTLDDSSKLDHGEETLTKLEIGLLKSRVIDHETHNDTLRHENSTPKNKIQSMKRQLKILEKKFTISHGNKLGETVR